LIRRLAVPLRRLCVIFPARLAGVVHQADVILGGEVILFGQWKKYTDHRYIIAARLRSSCRSPSFLRSRDDPSACVADTMAPVSAVTSIVKIIFLRRFSIGLLSSDGAAVCDSFVAWIQIAQ
jgi:hypothetical protein